MTKKLEEKKILKQLERAQRFSEAATCLFSAMEEIKDIYHMYSNTNVFDSVDVRPSKLLMNEIRKALNVFEHRTNTAVLEFEWPSTVHELQLKRKEAEQDERVDGIHQGQSHDE